MLNTNRGRVGSTAALGNQGANATQVLRPDLQIINIRGVADVTAVDFGLDVQASDVVVEKLAIHGFGSDEATGNIRVGSDANPNISNVTIQDNVLGSTNRALAIPTDSVDAVANQANGGSNLVIINADSGVIEGNIAAFANYHGIGFFGDATDWTIEANQVLFNAQADATSDGIRIADDAGELSIRQNRVAGNLGSGIDVQGSAGDNLISQNTVSTNGGNAIETAGVRLASNGNEVTGNLIESQTGPWSAGNLRFAGECCLGQ